MPGIHAIVSPSAASKWLVCAPSARLEEVLPDTEGEAAKEGTLAHSVGELIIMHRSNRITNKQYRTELDALKENEHYSKGLHEYADSYAVFVLERFAEARTKYPSAELFVEHQLDLSDWIPEGFGTGDAAVAMPDELDIIDLKYGKGVRVEAKGNKQLRIYALGWLEKLDLMYRPRIIRMTIYQPRLDNIETDTITYDELIAWANEELKDKAQKAFNGSGEYVAGPHCKFCHAKNMCRAHAEMQVRIACEDFAEFLDGGGDLKDPALLTEEEIAGILSRGADFKSWITATEEHALQQAIGGTKYPGYKLVHGRGVRSITDADGVEKLLVKEGFSRLKIWQPQKMIGITEMEKLVGKKWFDTNVAPFTTKPEGAPTLVPESDKRLPFKPKKTAAEDFEEITEE